MFTGIIEATAKILRIENEKTNKHFFIAAPFLSEVKVDQSIAHNGVCLTVVEILKDSYRVTAIDETLKKTSMSDWKEGDLVNLERCLTLAKPLDGHIVQGHVDTTATCTEKLFLDGSWKFTFQYHQKHAHDITVEKGSICVNGVSLTVVDSKDNSFSVCIIPYTYEHTNFKYIEQLSIVNLEFDVIGKYVAKMLGKI
ncbi:MAG: riboflavin synthase [Bacteroidetes bacterium]|nr:riboflavin synthase [Bacteroidota bacterium]